MTQGDRLVKIESEVRQFVRAAYPAMAVRAKYWSHDPSRIALYFIDERFRGLYPRQRYHYLVHLIPDEYYRSNLADSVWFELTPGEDPASIEYPDEQLIAEIKPDVLGALQQSGFFTALDELVYPKDGDSHSRQCSGDFRHSKQVLQTLGFVESDWSDVFHVLMDEGAFCDCEVLYNVAPESRLRADYWRTAHAEKE
jgi:Protein of unknown function (DUF2695)